MSKKSKKPKPPRPGEALQKLVAAIEECLAGSDNTTVESPAYLRDIRTGRRREHDVLITHQLPHRTIRTSVECKDHGRPVGVSIVEAFHTKCQDTKVNKGVIVSTRRGFTGPAVTKARSLDIDCLTAEEANQTDWRARYQLFQTRRRILSAHVSVEVENQILRPAILYEQQGDGSRVEVHQNVAWMRDHFKRVCEQGLISHLTKIGTHMYKTGIGIHEVERFVIVDAAGTEYRPKVLMIHYLYEDITVEMPLHFHSYGESGATTRYDVVSAHLPMDTSDFDVEITIVEPPNGEPMLSRKEIPKAPTTPE